MTLAFPTPLHEEVAGLAVSFFSEKPGVHAVLVIASCATGKAVPESDLDMAVLVDDGALVDLDREWSGYRASNDKIRALCDAHVYSQLHLDLINGVYEPSRWDDSGGPDEFEKEIGNHIAYSAPIWESGDAFSRLKDRWLPYYDEGLRAERLTMVRDAVLLDLDFVPFYVKRELPFQAFERVHKAFQEFLQALFIARRTYPLAHAKWIRYQVCDLLGLPELYEELPAVPEVPHLEGPGILRNAGHLRDLLERWVPAS